MNTRVLVVVGAVLVFALAGYIFWQHTSAKHEVFRRTAEGLIAEEKYGEALALLARAQQLAPNYAPAYHAMGIAYGKLGQQEEAEECLRRALALAPNDPRVMFNLSAVLARKGAYAEALDLLGRAEKERGEYPAVGPARAKIWCAMGKEAARAENAAEAESLLTKAVGADPNCIEAQYALGVLYRKQGRYEDSISRFTAVTHLRPGAKVAPALAASYRLLGEELARRGNAAGAADAYRRALQLQPDDGELHYRLGAALAEGGECEAARRELAAAFRLKPDLSPDGMLASRMEAEAREKREAGDVDGALNLMETAAAIDPGRRLTNERAELYYLQGQKAAAEKDAEKAMVLWKKAEALAPALPGLKAALARSAADAGRTDEAIARYENLHGAEPGNKEAAGALAGLHLKKGSYEAAARLFQTLGDEGRGRLSETYRKWFAACEEDEDWERAGDISERWMRCDPGSREAGVALGIAMGNTGRNREAIDAFKKVLRELPPPVFPTPLPSRKARHGVIQPLPRDMEEYIRVHYLLGMRYREAGMAKEAEEASARHYAWGLGYINLGDSGEQQVTEFSRAADIEPESYRNLMALGGAFYRQRRYARALDAYNRAAALKPDDPVAQNNIGMVYAARGNPVLAERSLLNAIALNYNYVSACDNLSTLYKRMGRKKDSDFWRKRTKQLEPERYILEDGLYFE